MGLLAQEDEQQREDRLDGEGCEERTQRRLGEDASQQVGVLGVVTLHQLRGRGRAVQGSDHAVLVGEVNGEEKGDEGEEEER